MTKEKRKGGTHTKENVSHCWALGTGHQQLPEVALGTLSELWTYQKTLIEEIRADKYLDTFWHSGEQIEVQGQQRNPKIFNRENTKPNPQDTVEREEIRVASDSFYNTSLGLFMEHWDSWEETAHS